MSKSVAEIVEASMDLQRIMRRRMTDIERMGINLLQLHALLALHERPSMTMKEFAGMLRITSPSATAFVARLSAMGLVRRTHDTVNRKLVRIRVTPKGQALIRNVVARRNRIVGEIFAVIPPAEQRTFARILRHVVSSHRLPKAP